MATRPNKTTTSCSLMCCPSVAFPEQVFVPRAAGSVRCSTARDVEYGAGAERTLFRGEPRNERGDFFGPTGACHRNPRRHVCDGLVTELRQNIGSNNRLRDAVHINALRRDFF